LLELGNLIFPCLEPTMEAAESPIPTTKFIGHK
jgi:hypothetical protein